MRSYSLHALSRVLALFRGTRVSDACAQRCWNPRAAVVHLLHRDPAKERQRCNAKHRHVSPSATQHLDSHACVVLRCHILALHCGRNCQLFGLLVDCDGVHGMDFSRQTPGFTRSERVYCIVRVPFAPAILPLYFIDSLATIAVLSRYLPTHLLSAFCPASDGCTCLHRLPLHLWCVSESVPLARLRLFVAPRACVSSMFARAVDVCAIPTVIGHAAENTSRQQNRSTRGS